MPADLREALKQTLPGIRADLDALIRVPSVSADSPGEVRRSAELTATLFPGAEILDDIVGGAPAVLARYPAPPGKPTVLLYAHHDVQPPGDLDAWSSPPFEPRVSGGRLYARGSADDKAGIAAHLAALRAFGHAPPVGVTVLIEGEEEIGSPTLGAFLARHRDLLEADAIVLADSENLAPDAPAFTTTLRGLAACVIEVRTLRHGVHSGASGATPDALSALCRVLATLHDDNGDAAIEGLAASTTSADYSEERLRSESGILPGVPLWGTGTVAERFWTKPAVSVLAIDSPAVDGVSNTLQPMARAKVSLRVAPGDDARKAQAALAEHLRKNAPWGVRVKVIDADLAQPHAIDTAGPIYDAARRAYGEAYGAPVVEIGSGGAIPLVAEFAATFPEAAILVTSPGGDTDSRAHGPDESLDLAGFEKACLAEALLLAELGAAGVTAP
ncbi:M20/M25/M40 family metallo-hydrolase [Spirillospora sp. CA-294931]|uniref:M20/M25/M40 family metallo-hydrolase n=1 Tax=Spirillospora sp. CA-294931 TaxID=3240042 RepID=UPI003D8D406B